MDQKRGLSPKSNVNRMDQKRGLSPKSNVMEEGVPTARYTRFGEKIRQAIPGPVQCSVGCGGRNCKWENPSRWGDDDQAIKGVFSSWVLEDVVAMSRPSTEIIHKYKMIEQFKRHNINSIINLQRPGEHASCGPPLDKESLFTYKPQHFMDNDVFFYNFGWKDYGVTSLHTILDMVKVMSFALQEGRVAVHCHAGLGRTGVLIACYLVFAERLNPATAITRVRQKRSNSIQTRGQIACITEFWQFLKPLRIVFPQVVPHAKRLTLHQFLHRQKHLLHGLELRELKHVPKLVHVVCRRLLQIASGDGKKEDKLVAGIRKCNTVADMKETVPGAFVNESPVEPPDVFDHRLDFPGNSPTDVEAVLSPRVSRRTRSESTPRPQSAGELTFTPPPRAGCFKERSKSEISIKSLDEPRNKSVAASQRRTSWSGPLNNDVDINSLVDEILNHNVNNNNRRRRKRLLSPSVGGADHLIDSRAQPIGNEEAISSARKMRLSAVGKSDKILPTGSPTKNPRSSAKGKRNSPISPASPLPSEAVGNRDNDDVIVDDVIKSDVVVETDVPRDDITTASDDVIMEKPKMLSYAEVEESATPSVEKIEVEFQIGVKEDDVEEIIEINELEIMSDTDQENEDPYKLSSSVASKVSWNETMMSSDDVIGRSGDVTGPGDDVIRRGDDVTESVKREVSASSGRRTPLMYRAEKNMGLLSGSDDIINDDITTSSSEDDDDDVTIDDARSLSPPHPVARVEGTRSLCDLSKLADDIIAGDVINGDVIGGDVIGDDVIMGVEAARGFAYKLVDDEFLWEKVYTLQIKINSRGDAWPQVARATDPYVLAALMWSWVEHLSEPLLSPSAAAKFIEDFESGVGAGIVENFEKSLATLDEPVGKTIHSIVELILGFPPLPRELGVTVVNRCVGAVTQTYNDPVARTNGPGETLTSAQKLEIIFHDYLDAKFVSLSKQRLSFPAKERNRETTNKADFLQGFHPRGPSQGRDLHIREPSARSSSSTGSSTGSVALIPSIVVS